MTPADFLTRWARSGEVERATSNLFLHELMTLLGVPPPDAVTDDPARDAYVLEKPVAFADGPGPRSTGRIDLYKRGCFVLVATQGTSSPAGQQATDRAEGPAPGATPDPRPNSPALRGTARWETMMQDAYHQAVRCVRALPATEPRPPFVVVIDAGYCLDLYANFSGVADQYVPFPDPRTSRLRLEQLVHDAPRALLARLWTDPVALDPSRQAARVTRKLAERLAMLSAQLERAKHPADVVARFLMRCLFTMFAEDVELIPKNSFTSLLRDCLASDERQKLLPAAVQHLWLRMDEGGFSTELNASLRRFNSNLFRDATALPLTETQIRLLLDAAAADWTTVDPAIFGTLLERALSPTERNRLSAHYTPRRYLERLVLPTVLAPLRQEWAAAQAGSALRAAAGDVAGTREELVKFLRRLTSVRVLDPACGSGNFLYITLEHLKRLEGEVLMALERSGAGGPAGPGDLPTVTPRQLLGLELNPRTAAIADVVLRIGYLQWHLRTHGLTQLVEPLLDSFENIQHRDALLTSPAPEEGKEGGAILSDVQTVPPTEKEGTGGGASSYPPPATPRPNAAEWPEADFIVGNPPFLSASQMQEALGDDYTASLRQAYAGKVPDSADLAMWWWYKAAGLLRAGKLERFGFITRPSITQADNQRVVQELLRDPAQPISITYAIADYPWIDAADGAAGRVAVTVAERGTLPGLALQVVQETAGDDDAHDVVLTEATGTIRADLRVAADAAA